MRPLLLAALVAVAAQQERPGPASSAPTAEAGNPVELDVTSALEASVPLLELHRGYLGYLREHGAVLGAQRNMAALLNTTAFRQVFSEFDDALIADPEADRAFRMFYRHLHDYPAVQPAVDGLARLRFQGDAGASPWLDALDYLRTEPGLALPYLSDPALVTPTPEALYDALPGLRQDPALRDALTAAFERVESDPEAPLRIYPWWAKAYDAATPLGQAHERMMDYFGRNAGAYWAWHRAMIAEAEDLRAQQWLQHWRRRVRREPALRERYWGHVQTLLEEPQAAVSAEQRWRARFGAAPDWPPEQKPPDLVPLKPVEEAAELRRPVVPAPVKPTITPPVRPTIPMPAMPARPTMPAAPSRPVKPDIPPPPKKPSARPAGPD